MTARSSRGDEAQTQKADSSSRNPMKAESLGLTRFDGHLVEGRRSSDRGGIAGRGCGHLACQRSDAVSVKTSHQPDCPLDGFAGGRKEAGCFSDSEFSFV